MKTNDKEFHSLKYFLLGCLLGAIIVVGFSLSWILYRVPQSRVTAIENTEPVIVEVPRSSGVDDKPKEVTILFTGDVMLGRSVNISTLQNNNTSWPFINVSQVLKSADITYINLESPFAHDCPRTDKGMKFCSEPLNVQGLVESGIDIASVANNHSTNYGQEGLSETVTILKQNGIGVVGVGGEISLVKYGSKYTFLSFNDVGRFAGIAQADTSNMITKISTTKTSGELLVVTFHWGEEYQKLPTARQQLLAHLAIDAGADLVIGAHPHWVQTKEIYKGIPIYYSLGNFVFDQDWSLETKKGLAVRFTYIGEVLHNTEELPVYIEKNGQPIWQ